MYKVIKFFTDLQDNEHPYAVGDVFPRKGVKVSERRLAELAGSNNKQKQPLIRLVEETIPEMEEQKKPAAKKPAAKKSPKK